MSKIEVKNFSKYYGKFRAVNNISFSIEKGSIVGFVGKNGAGKSTTLRSILNLIKPTSGTISVDGLSSVKDNKAIKAFTSYMSSEVQYYDGLSCQDLFDLSSKIGQGSSDEINQIAEFLELDINKKLRQLSLGNKKKVAILNALLKDASLYLLDEPTSGLDPVMQEKFFSLLLEKKKAGATIFLSSHNLAEIEKYCDRVLIIKDGEIIEDIDMQEKLTNRPKVVSYTTKDGQSADYLYSEDINSLIKQLSTLDLENLEIKDSSVEDEFIKYYKGEK